MIDGGATGGEKKKWGELLNWYIIFGKKTIYLLAGLQLRYNLVRHFRYARLNIIK